MIRFPPVASVATALLILAVSALATAETGPNAPTPDASREPSADGYELVWSDEFNRNGPPDPANWGFETGFLRNQEAQWYRPENAWCERGLLVIEARRERIEVDPTAGSRPPATWAARRTHAEYTSASLKTRGKHDWLYGRFVMRAKVPAVTGAWPAFWTLGYGRWPACGEIDVMEYYDESILANVAWLGRWGAPKWDAVKTPTRQLGDAGWGDRFHEYRMDWDADSIDLFVDGQLLNTTSLADTINADDEAGNPFHKPHYVLVNLAIGGAHGGDPSATTFPIRYEIDYVRVYQRPERQSAGDSGQLTR